MKLSPLEVSNIRYSKVTKEGVQEITERVIIPTYVPDQNVAAIDVTGLPEQEVTAMLELYKEYSAYVEQARKTIFTFEDWANHTKGGEINAKWRKFAVSRVEIL